MAGPTTEALKIPEGTRPLNGTKTVFILESSPVIAADLSGAVDASGEYRVVHVAERDRALEVLEEHDRILIAFLEMSPGDAVGSDLVDALRARGAQVILTIGEAAEDAARVEGFGMLIRPFSDHMILHALADADPDGGSIAS